MPKKTAKKMSSQASFQDHMDRNVGGEGEMNAESGMVAYYIRPHVKQTANGNLQCDSGNSNRGSVAT